MRGRLSIFLFVVAVVVLLVALNAASYVRVGREPELEAEPDRSTSNAGPTGTRALFEFLEESGHRVVRWREEPAALLTVEGEARPATFVVVGSVRRPVTEDERKSLMRWVARGGRLVLIDREAEGLLPGDERWGVSRGETHEPEPDARADDGESLVAGTQPVAPSQPTQLTRAVERVAPSRFASRVHPRAMGGAESAATHEAVAAEGAEAGGGQETPTPTATPTPTPEEDSPLFGVFDDEEEEEKVAAEAPTVHLADERGAFLLDYKRGEGRVVVLSDPFIVANNGIARADNLQLAVNVITAGGGLVAFDEFHQGRGAAHNRVSTYFAGTPVLAMLGQAAFVVALFVWSRGRRFARPLPAARPDRRSKLEFVASMAELQQRARAFDLAIENIYSRTRRALARYGGTDSAAHRAEIAAAVSSRSGIDRARLEELMRECEDAAAGAKLTPRRALHLARSLRELERTLGIRMRAREIKQANRS
ncbi:MAG TPA: DUF4350 domain-containing protein [Pyrinomonadaceae bacterium]|nr:DUF4350 domain-containing protein [Pyrinomonadaceae bacterium]